MTVPVQLPPYCHPVFLGEVDSTNDVARTMAAEGAPHLTLVVAEAQRAGRGRRGRDWVSTPGNLFFSAVLRPDCPVATAAQIGFLAALAVREAIGEFLEAPATVRCKWPNDVLIDGAKVSGILLESSATGAEKVDWVVLGIGVNIAHAPDDVARPATSLARAGARGSTPRRLLEAWVPHFAGWYARWQADGFDPVRAAWLAHAADRGGPVEVRLADAVLHGHFADLDSSGALVLDQAAGGRRLIAAGDVFATGT
jgi:BirA family biotin operon repressor/biotin-[acetyl-CoA-carboxylase] ligase